MGSWRITLDAIADAGFDYAKGQDWSPIDQMDRSEEWKTRCQRWSVNYDFLRWIQGTADIRQIKFFCSMFTHKAIQRGDFLHYPVQKIASSEAANDDLLRGVSRDRPCLISFGEVSEPWRVLLSIATVNARTQAIPMACIAKYPTSASLARCELDMIEAYAKLGLEVGWSSHVPMPDAVRIACEAVKRGATWIEVHAKAVDVEGAPDNGPWGLDAEELKQFAAEVRACQCI
jgi:sialic acid synthase SpsE